MGFTKPHSLNFTIGLVNPEMGLEQLEPTSPNLPSGYD